MQLVASLTVEIIGWFGIPALQRGNLIEVGTGVVGIDEACSGIRSFQSTLMASLFLGELYRLTSLRRLGLFVGGVSLSFGLNVVRTLFLTYQASAHGIAAIDKWHDSAGMGIFLVSFACLWGVALLMKSRSQVIEAAANRAPTSGSSLRTPLFRRYLVAVGCWVVLILFATEVWYRSHEIMNPGGFSWTVNLTATGDAVKEIELPRRTQDLIASDSGGGWSWSDAQRNQWSVFFFRWNPSSIASVLRARIHRPERCLPASGLHQVADGGLENFAAAGFNLPFQRSTFEAEGKSLHVFFCQWEDGSEQQGGMWNTKLADRIRSVLVGRRKLGQQTMEVVLTGPQTLAEATALLRRALPDMVRVETPQLSVAEKH